LKSQGSKLKVAYCLGDDVGPLIETLTKQGETFEHLEDPKRALAQWHLKPLTASAYVGARGVVAALRDGADVIIVGLQRSQSSSSSLGQTGRVTDATPTMASAAWWHGWKWDKYTALAGSLLAGHCIECGSYVTGGNFSGFKTILDTYYNFGLPIAEIEADGTYTVTLNKGPGLNGMVSTATVSSQLLYEIQGDVRSVRSFLPR
jgi:hypothetical protein